MDTHLSKLKLKVVGGRLCFSNMGTLGRRWLYDTLPYVKRNPTTGECYTYPTISTFLNLWVKGKEVLLKQDDPGVKSWLRKMAVLVPRMDVLRKGGAEINLPKDIDYVLTPYPHQKEAIAFALNVNKCALWLDMGLGKTYTSITISKIRRSMNKVHKTIVVAPRSLLYQWESELNRFDPGVPVVVYKARKRASLDKFFEAAKSHTDMYFLINYESIGSCLNDLVNLGFDMFILDESTKIKNPKAKRTKDTVYLCTNIRYGVELTGMSYVNSPLDLYSQFLALDRTVYGESEGSFTHRYIDYGTAPFGRFIRGFKNMDDLKRRAHILAFSRTKNQCLDLPEKVYQTRRLPLSDVQATWYDNLLDQIRYATQDGTMNAVAPVDSKNPVTVEYVVAMIEKLQQITSGFVNTDEGETLWLGSHKYDELYDIVTSSSDSFLVWARHTLVQEKIADMLRNKGINVEVLNRTSSNVDRKRIKEEFKQGNIKVLVLQIQSECRGNDFTCEAGSVSAVFFENTASIEERSQAEDRQHRIGMLGTAVYVDLVCEDTYDEGIKLLLESKRTLAEYIREKNFMMLLGRGGRVSKTKTSATKRRKAKDADEK